MKDALYAFRGKEYIAVLTIIFRIMIDSLISLREPGYIFFSIILQYVLGLNALNVMIYEIVLQLLHLALQFVLSMSFT